MNDTVTYLLVNALWTWTACMAIWLVKQFVLFMRFILKDLVAGIKKDILDAVEQTVRQ